MNNMFSPDYYSDTLFPLLLYYIYLLKLSVYLIYDTMHKIKRFLECEVGLLDKGNFQQT